MLENGLPPDNSLEDGQDKNKGKNANIPPGVNLNDLPLDDLCFPANVLPSPFYEFIKDCNAALNFPNDYTGAAVLTAVATIIGKSAKVKVKSGWFEFASFFMAIIGNSGTTKSHPIDKAFEPLINIDRLRIKKYQSDYCDYEQYLEMSKKDKKEAPPVEKPKLVKSILHNFTPEILCQRLADNERGCTVVSEELATFLEGMNNYSKGDQTSTYLSFWSNKSTSVDRVSKPVPLFIQEPLLNIIGSLQIRILSKLFPLSKSDNGFLQRFLFAFPDNTEKKPINDNELNEGVINNYCQWIEDYERLNPIEIDLETQKQEPKIYYWSDEAKVYFYKWQAANTTAVNANTDTLKGEILNKFDIHFVRLSLILQIMDDYRTNQISIKAVDGAAKLCAYFINNAFKVLNVLENAHPAELLPENKAEFLRTLPDNFTTAQANIIGKALRLNEKFVQRFLNDTMLFTKVAHGQYIKTAKK